MKSIVINIHSFIDVITNSSTEIYCNAKDNALEMIEEVVQKVLTAAGSDKKFSDLFECWYIAWDAMERQDDEELEEKDFTKEEIKKIKDWKILTWQEVDKVKEFMRDEDWSFLSVKVTAKNSDEDFADLFDIFEYEESYNG